MRGPSDYPGSATWQAHWQQSTRHTPIQLPSFRNLRILSAQSGVDVFQRIAKHGRETGKRRHAPYPTVIILQPKDQKRGQDQQRHTGQVLKAHRQQRRCRRSQHPKRGYDHRPIQTTPLFFGSVLSRGCGGLPPHRIRFAPQNSNYIIASHQKPHGAQAGATKCPRLKPPMQASPHRDCVACEPASSQRKQMKTPTATAAAISSWA